jgi:hypothetical protein
MDDCQLNGCYHFARTLLGTVEDQDMIERVARHVFREMVDAKGFAHPAHARQFAQTIFWAVKKEV